jgi:hypothetical protein
MRLDCPRSRRGRILRLPRAGQARPLQIVHYSSVVFLRKSRALVRGE